MSQSLRVTTEEAKVLGKRRLSGTDVRLWSESLILHLTLTPLLGSKPVREQIVEIETGQKRETPRCQDKQTRGTHSCQLQREKASGVVYLSENFLKKLFYCVIIWIHVFTEIY
ncbi:uncharacterized protein LOC143227150 [Tachypleus tridentatus]|uniref:uncharacterized protein LOC143227150 n=1 Tax=Tachypleus tridentatus TaxID=6853 RepID=UPI003FCFED3F